MSHKSKIVNKFITKPAQLINNFNKVSFEILCNRDKITIKFDSLLQVHTIKQHRPFRQHHKIHTSVFDPKNNRRQLAAYVTINKFECKPQIKLVELADQTQTHARTTGRKENSEK